MIVNIKVLKGGMIYYFYPGLPSKLLPSYYIVCYNEWNAHETFPTITISWYSEPVSSKMHQDVCVTEKKNTLYHLYLFEKAELPESGTVLKLKCLNK